MDKQLVVSPAPHLKSPETIKSVMVDVLAALVPAAIAAVIFF
ncbi:MAG: electron transporter RnfD, partial [Firmicutes bacterium]|nr:electron transporter RnfD [Bacillota bacterium]NLN54512.1 electron transporter RnfD [Bacillota bacterium]